MLALPVLIILTRGFGTSACSFDISNGMRGDDNILRSLSEGSPVLPSPVSLENNAFHTNGMFRSDKALTGNDKPLLDFLADFAAQEFNNEELCYWSYASLPPPPVGPSAAEPSRGYWDVAGGYYDQDIEWVEAYGDVAGSRLQHLTRKDGPISLAMCTMGSEIISRRCNNGRGNKTKCIPPLLNQTLAWPAAIFIWRVGHPEAEAAVESWRGHADQHFPMINWATHASGTTEQSARPWTGAMPRAGEIGPSSMPRGPLWPISKDTYWGAPKIAKVVKCSDIPSKYLYPEEPFICDHMPDASAHVSPVDEGYAVWKSLQSVFPPTKPCADDLDGLNRLLKQVAPGLLPVANCSEAYPKLQAAIPNFDCDNADLQPRIRDVCCSVCGAQTIPVTPPPAPSPIQSSYQCALCTHIYDAEKDGQGKAFEDLPNSWRCPICGAPKSQFHQRASGEMVHEVLV